MCAHVKMQCNAYLFDAKPKSLRAIEKIEMLRLDFLCQA